MVTLSNCLNELVTLLVDVTEPEIEAWEILRVKTDYTQKDMLIKPDHLISELDYRTVKMIAEERKLGQPLAYCLDIKHFWEYDFFVSPAVLIPRNDTECLIEWVLGTIPASQATRVLDLGTGSGCIALTIAKQRPQWEIVATDNSVEALLVAQKNSERLFVNNCEFYQGSWFEALPKHSKGFDLIISNPPYIDSADEHLAKGDLPHEPREALVSGKQGLEDCYDIIRLAPSDLNQNGRLIIEHGYTQQSDLLAMLEQSGQWYDCVGHKDLQGNPRFVTACLR